MVELVEAILYKALQTFVTQKKDKQFVTFESELASAIAKKQNKKTL